MHRFHQVVFMVSLLALSWFAMQAVHEFGHVFGALVTGGTVQRVVLHPLEISRTDVSPNPNPLLVVWSGPILGCVLPFIAGMLVPRRLAFARNVGLFFAGFCLIANGAYIGIGSFDRVGDCGVMFQHGTPHWVLLAFGTLTISWGTLVWHQLGSVGRFWAQPECVDPLVAYLFTVALVLLMVAEFAMF